MKIKCVRCGAKSQMALCPECLPADIAAQSLPASSFRKSLPTRPELKGGIADGIDEIKQLFTQARTWVKKDFKRYTAYKNWNIAFSKAGWVALAKDTSFAVLPLIIIGFVSAKLVSSQFPDYYDLFIPGAQIAALWILNFVLGIGITVSGNASLGFLSGSAGGTARLLASGLTVLLTYLLIRKSRVRAAEGNFTLNPQSEIVGTAAVLSTISFVLTSLTANTISGGTDLGRVSASGSISVTVDFYSLFIGPLIISAISVLLGSYAVKSKKKFSDSLNQSVAFLLGATAVVTVVVVLAALWEREITSIFGYLAVAPTVVLAVLVAASGVPLVNTGAENDIFLLSSSTGAPIDITNPTPSLILYFGLLLITLLLIGTVMGFRVDPRTFTTRHSTRIILTITGIVLFLNVFFMFYAFGSASVALGLASGSDSLAIFANPLLLIPASLIWGAVYVFGARYLTPFAAVMSPSLVTKVIPKLRISISEYYLRTPEAGEELTPLQKQTKTMQAAKAKSIAKKGVLVVIAFFIITGPVDDFIANKLSSPTSAVSGFFDSLQSNNAARALDHVSISNVETSKVLLSDEVLSNYLQKPKVTSIEITEKYPDYATAEVEYTLNGLPLTAELELIKDSENKLYKLFPVWKISQEVLRQVDTYSYDGKSVTFGGAAVPAETSSLLLFPGVVTYNYEDPIYTKKLDYTLPVEPNEENSYEVRDATYKADAEIYIEKLARRSITECNSMTENPQSTCPYYQAVRTTTLKSVENFTVTNIRENVSGHSATLDFDFEANYTDPSTGVTKKTKYRYSRTVYLDKQDGFVTIDWDY